MAFFLRAGDGASLDYVALASEIQIALASDFVIEIDAAITDPAQNWRPIGQLGSTNNRIVKFGSQTSIVLSDGAGNTVTLDASGTIFTNRNSYKFSRIGGAWSGEINGISAPVSGSVGNTLAFSTLLTYNTADQSRGPSDLYRLKISSNGALAHDYDPSASNGTGSILADTVGGNNGTLTNFPADDSQWVFYAGAEDPAINITQPALIPGGEISGTYSNYATIPTTLTVSDGTNTITIPTPTITNTVAGDGTNEGTYSGTMPALPTTGTANLVLFGDVTVELS